MTECQIRLITLPLVTCIAEQRLRPSGLETVLSWLWSYRPECVPEESGWEAMFPTVQGDRPRFDDERVAGSPSAFRRLSDNELLTELAGRTCYHSYGLAAGRKTNAEYIANMQAGEVPHASVLYHAKMSFFIANVSRRVSHELIRNYVGADRDEEGSPSQESTRFTEHPGHYVVPPYVLAIEDSDARNHELAVFESQMRAAYNDGYLAFIERHCIRFAEAHGGQQPKGMDRKRIYEAASFYLHHSVTTSFVWTTNPMAMAKFFHERCHELADAEMQRFANAWKALALAEWPNLFPQPWMRLPGAAL